MILKKRQQQNLQRLQNVLISDKQFSPQKLQKVLKSDAYVLLSNYCSLSPEDLSTSVEVDKDGIYKILIYAKSNRLKIFGSLPESY